MTTRDSSLAAIDAADSFDAAPPDASGAEAATAADVLALCEAQCAYLARCDPPGAEDCASSCVAASPSPEVFLSVFLTTSAACFGDLACAASPSDCIEAGLVAVDPDWANDTLTLACLERSSECDFVGGICRLVAGMSVTGRATVQACIDGECAAVSACLDDAGLM